MLVLNQRKPSYAIDLSQIGTLGARVEEVAGGSRNSTDPAESPRGWLHERVVASGLPDTAPIPSGGDSAVRSDGIIHAVSRPTSSTLELLLYPLAFLLLIVLLVMLLTALPRKSALSTPRKQIDPKGLVCSSGDCYQDAEYLSGLLSWEIDDPCDSFQPFVCRRWASMLKDSPLTQSVSSDDVYVSIVEQRVQAIYHKRPQHFRIPVLLSNLMEKCRNIEHVENDGWGLLLEFMFNTSLEGFPLTPPVRGRLNVWTTAASLLRKTGTEALLSVSVASHPFVESRDAPVVAPPRTLSASGVDIEESIRMHTAAIVSAIRSLNKEFVPPVHTMKAVELARTLEAICESKVRETKLEVVFTEPRAELVEFLIEVISGVSSVMFIKNQFEIWIQAPSIVTQIVELIRNTESYVVLNYLCVQLMVQMSPFIPAPKALTDFHSTLTYGKARTDVLRSHICLRAVEKAAVDDFMSTWYFSPASNATAFETYVELHERTFVQTLSFGSSGRWTRSAFSSTCWHERYPSTIYVPALVFNITLPLSEKSRHLCRAAVRVVGCIFDAILAETNSTSVETLLSEEGTAKLRNTATCHGLDGLDPPSTSLRDALTVEFTFRHFEKSVKKSANPLRLHLPQGKVLTSSQLFFVYLMLQHCEKKGGLDTLKLGSAHNLNVVFSRDSNFAAAFNCSRGSPMNPGKKCSSYRV
ncbi:uncharacterized protein LOC142802798 [Rhipicephalus microplus]|uniref:uncharacterized protein LOC142802798 n=1 Tax=Rhipicephalus microplus TaxID=6941 RepID=UPI003F6B348E